MTAADPDRRRDGSELEHRARDLAQVHSASPDPGITPTPLDRLPILASLVRRAYASFVAASEERGVLSGVAEWLLDNFYVVQQAVRQIDENMPAGYYRRLPKLDASALRGYPRVYGVAREILEVVEGHLDIDQVKQFVRAYQEVRPLTMGEIWALPIMLRLSLVELLSWTAARAADLDVSVARGPLPDPPDFEHVADEAIVAACVNSLRAIGGEDWEAFFESVSLVEETLCRDPANVYPVMDFESRDRYRGVVEDLARAVRGTEQDVAHEALRLAREHGEHDAGNPRRSEVFGSRRQHVGFYLAAEGRRQLEEAVGFHPGLLERARRWIFAHPTCVYLGSIGFIVALVLTGGLMVARAGGAGLAALMAVAALGLIPASVVGVNVVNAVITRTVPPRVLPKFDFTDGVPHCYRTMVVVPCMLTSDDEVDFLLRQLELHYLGNADPEFGFALLTDFADAPEKHMPEDEPLLRRAKEGIRQLNREYAGGWRAEGDGGPFFLFHRERLWNPSEESWMGWERKRGKLAEFNRLLRGDETTSYVVKMGDLDFLADVVYVITLDADTVFPLESGQQLVATLAHPLNQAEFEACGEADGGPARRERVVAGYTVLQPRTEVKPPSVIQTRFSRIFAGDAGLDLYTRAVSDVYQDFFGEGIFIGKGIYDVDAFERSLRGRMPENALLSHDLFEGIHGRAGLVTDVVLFEDYPPTYLSYADRKHRWVRGDWQILPWLLPRVPHAGEGRIPSPLSVLDRWKIFDNLRRSLRAPALLALLVAGWLFLPGSPLVWTLAAVITGGFPLLAGAVTEVARRLQGGPRPGGTAGLGSDVARWLLSLAFLPYETILMIDAIGTTLVRLTISRKRLLQWTTAAHTVRVFGRRSEIGLLWRQMRGAPVVALLLTAAVGLLRPLVLPLAAPLLLAWFLSPQIAAWISQPLEEERPTLSGQERRRLRRLARRTWLYFERFVGPEDHWLPPDHFQEDPRGVVARRTSPTNIGLMLVSTLSACDMGYVSLMDVMLRVSDAFDGMDQLEQYRGHFLNWYDTRDLSTLRPRYVSTVDSGNLAACLIALRHGLEELQRAPLVRWQRWRGLCDTVGVLREVVERIEEQEEVAEEARAFRVYARGLCDRISAVREEPHRWVPLLAELEEDVGEELNRRLQALLDAGSGVLTTAALRDLRLWSERIRTHLHDLRQEIDRMLPWLPAMDRQPEILSGRAQGELDQEVASRLSSSQPWQTLQETLPRIPRLDEVAEICGTAGSQLAELISLLDEERDAVDEAAQPRLAEELERAREWCLELEESLEAGRMAIGGLRVGLEQLVERAEQVVQDMDFRFLYDRQRDVFHIGYRVDTEELDGNHYDLLASEARIASIVAIGKRDVPKRHWLHLDRPLSGIVSREQGRRALLSWGGSMFEYLMPDLMMQNYPETLLDQANRAAVGHHIAYGRQKGVPWGVSESGYYRFDAQMNYQYRGFGVPGLGRKRGLDEDLVIAPYASLLAVKLAPGEVLKNVDRLIDEEALGHYGFYEALDYTRSRLPIGQRRAVVRSYMAHHQGMIMAALANYLNGRAIVGRFHQDPRVQAVEFLLQEQVPRGAPLEEAPEESVGVERSERERVALEPWSVPTDPPVPEVHFLSNGRYSVLITEAGAGYSAFTPGRGGADDSVALTRWRADTTLDAWGTWIYVQDREGGVPWSATQQPTGVPGDEEEVQFYPHQVAFRRRHGDVSVHTEIVVAPEDDLEIRRVTLTNHSDEVRQLRTTSYGEVVLAPQDQDRRHPAFNKLFIESKFVADGQALLFTRRPRSAEEEPLVMAHALVTSPDLEASAAYETDRARFIGRGRTARAPAALRRASDGGSGEGDEPWLSGTTGATLDPIMALGQEMDVEPHTTVRLAYLTMAGESREDVLALARRYQAWPRIERTFEQAHAQSEVELRDLGLEVPDLRDVQQLLSALVYPSPSMRAAPETLGANRRGQSALWPHGISGDYPIVLVRIADEERIPLVRELLRAHTYWRDRQLKVDLVILNERDVGYAQELTHQLNQVIAQMDSDAWLNRRGGIFLLRADQMDEAARTLLATAARAVLDAGEGSLGEQVSRMVERPRRLPAFRPSGPEMEPPATPPVRRPTDLRFDNGFGGFSADGREYVVYVDSGAEERGMDGWTPAPWVNVIANPWFGFLVSETGFGTSWAGNSGENRLTPWRNDPVSDPPAEALYVRDEETGAIWSPTPLPAGEDAPYLVRHGAGTSVFEHHSHGLKQRVRLFAAADAPVKVVQLRLENTWDRVRRLTATFYAEWVLGIDRDRAQQYVVSQYDPETTALLARNPYHPEVGERDGRPAAVAFVAAGQEPHGLTADRAEFLGRKGDMREPAGLNRVGLSGTVGPGLDPCAAVQVHVDLQPGEAEEVFFLLGQGEDREEAVELVREYRDGETVAEAWESARARWDEVLGTVTVETPDAAMDLLLNRWLLYQALGCRVWARSALYQSSGAYGFRDQLQDVMSLLHAAPEIAREHILRSARHQFEEGDVLHWWHPVPGEGGRGGRSRGVRTRISDDLLWLPYVVAEYVEATGDEGILDEETPFRTAEPLEEGEHERYGYYELTEEEGSVYEHCLRALDRGSTAGRHGLPLIGAGDWNDGLNRVGLEGRGESVWLGWFLYATLCRFARLCERMEDSGRAEELRERARALRRAVEESAWDGNWYIRATYNDGTPLGSAESDECKIASMAQSWAVLSGAGDAGRAERAMASVAERLVERDGGGMLLLFTPPFDRTPRDPGYIKGYPPGVRENGGQYTHAAVWAVWAYTELGQGDRAADLFRLLNPIYHADTRDKAERYRVEPYVVAADVYSAAQHRGRGGWTWYTGSSGWMYRLGMEAILGLRRVGDGLQMRPCIPKHWKRYRMTYRYHSAVYEIEVENPDGVNRSVRSVRLDGEELPEGRIPLVDDGDRHDVRVTLG
ncbi:MAG: glucoamylase family protein [Anaerolineae bacterium]